MLRHHLSARPGFVLAPLIDPSPWDAKRIVASAKKAGVKHIVFTTKRHDGFARWDSAVNDWNHRNTAASSATSSRNSSRRTSLQGMEVHERRALGLAFRAG
ncbi:alpha-L-fucosidase [Streptomyces sp. BE20]|uniref:alpha-L-fucosidase n=1 Tax=Streptomyces sp. BE20 TaxID=3002525 RepID=UPI003FA74CB3